MTRLYTNNFSTTLDGNITDVATTLDVASATGLPSIGSGDTCQLTIDDGTNIEIVTATAVASETITITRGQEGTSGTAFSDGAAVELRPTAAAFIDPDDLRLPIDAAPGLDTDGQIAIDTTVTDFSHGIMQYYDGELMAVVAVPNGELTSPSDGDIISYNATNDEFELVAGSAATSPAFNAVATGTTLTNNTLVKIGFQTETFDTTGDYDNATNYRFTPSVAGKYLIQSNVSVQSLGDTNQLQIRIYKNGSSYRYTKIIGAANDTHSITISDIIDMNGSTDYVEIFAFQDSGGDKSLFTSLNATWFSGSKIG